MVPGASGGSFSNNVAAAIVVSGGPIAFGTTVRSATLSDWPSGDFIGIHGTDRPALIPGRISHGCIRMRSTDIRRLAALMPLGTPVTIR